MSKNGLPRKPLTKRRLKNLILNVLKNPFNMVVLVSLIILFCLIIIPLLTMISSTFTLAQGELRRVQGHVGDFTLYYWKYILTGKLASAVLWGPLKNSFICGFFTVLVSVPSGLRAGLADDPHGSPRQEDLGPAGDRTLYDPLLDQGSGLAGHVPQLHLRRQRLPGWLGHSRSPTGWLTALSPLCCACPCTITHSPTSWSPAHSAPSTPSWRKWARSRAPAKRRSCGTSRCP